MLKDKINKAHTIYLRHLEFSEKVGMYRVIILSGDTTVNQGH